MSLHNELSLRAFQALVTDLSTDVLLLRKLLQQDDSEKSNNLICDVIDFDFSKLKPRNKISSAKYKAALIFYANNWILQSLQSNLVDTKEVLSISISSLILFYSYINKLDTQIDAAMFAQRQTEILKILKKYSADKTMKTIGAVGKISADANKSNNGLILVLNELLIFKDFSHAS